MPVWSYNLLLGLFVGYYATNQTIRNLVNQIIIMVLKIAHRLIAWFLAVTLKGLNWCYEPYRQAPKARQTPQRIQPTVQRKRIETQTVTLPDGKKGLWVSDEKLAEWMANPDLKYTEKETEK